MRPHSPLNAGAEQGRPRRVLIVTSGYPPAMMADVHRARLLAWHLPACGWEVDVLCPDETYQLAVAIDTDGDAFCCPDARVHRVAQWQEPIFRRAGIRSIGWRALVPLDRAALQLVQTRRFDLVYFSTTQFSLFLLGPRWKKQYGLPYVLDFHDPCYRDDVGYHAGARPGLKRMASRRLAKVIESLATRNAAGIIAVSPHYLDALRARYGADEPSWLAENRSAVIPFAGSADDLRLAGAALTAREQAEHGKRRRIVYVGAGGPIMERAFAVVCAGLAELKRRKSGVLAGISIELYGTMTRWRTGDRRHLADVARQYGVIEYVQEEPQRVSYRRSLELLVGSDGALILGVDEAGYMPSKLATYALSGKPLLAALHSGSPARELLRLDPASMSAVWFGHGSMNASDTATVLEGFLQQVNDAAQSDRGRMLGEYLPPAMARRHAELFDACLAAGAEVE